MRVTQFVFHKPQELQALASQIQALSADLCLLFASPEYFENDEFIRGLNQCCDNLIGCSAAGEIHQTEVTDHSAVINLLHFDDAQINLFSTELRDMHESHQSGVNLADQVNNTTLRKTNSTQALLIFGQGVNINGSGLLEGLQQHLKQNIHISGGLAGDNGLFQRTYTCINENVYTDRVVAVSIAGSQLTVKYGCYGGWRAFGPLRRITKSTGNVLYELDDLPAPEVYKNYLGEYAQQLPASGLLFPFEMISNERETTGLLRTIIGIDETQQAFMLAGHQHCELHNQTMTITVIGEN